MKQVVIIDYGYGNLHSIAKAFEHVKGASQATITLSCEVSAIRRATHVVLPGVGAFADCMAGLNRFPDTKMALIEAVQKQGKPFLGVCVGMQLMADEGLEHGRTQGFGWIDASVIPIPRHNPLKIPHMGWNMLHVKRSHPVLRGLTSGEDVYFVHSYYMDCTKTPDVVCAEVEYGVPIPAVVVKDNKIGMQFHPEKSQQVGLRLLENFISWSC